MFRPSQTRGRAHFDSALRFDYCPRLGEFFFVRENQQPIKWLYYRPAFRNDEFFSSGDQYNQSSLWEARIYNLLSGDS
jgi:hypothetical protein